MTLSDLSQEEAELILQVLEPFANAYDRMILFNVTDGDSTEAEVDDCPVYAETSGMGFDELFADKNEAHGQEPDELLRISHFSKAKRLVDIIKGEMHSEEEE